MATVEKGLKTNIPEKIKKPKYKKGWAKEFHKSMEGIIYWESPDCWADDDIPRKYWAKPTPMPKIN